METADVSRLYDSLRDYQKEKVVDIMRYFTELNNRLESTYPARCPCCKGDGPFIKKGFSGKKQRYQCKSCGKKFTYDAGSITSWSHQSKDAWATVIADTLQLESLDATCEKIGVSHATAFYMRHKILRSIEQMNENKLKLEGFIEVGETYVLESGKGTKLTERAPRKRGLTDRDKKMPSEQFCVCTAADSNRSVVLTCASRAKASSEDISNALCDCISEKSVFLCSGNNAYGRLAEEKDCKMIELDSNEGYGSKSQVEDVQNDLSLMLGRFRGIATKYLNRYLSLLSYIESNTDSCIEEKADSVRRGWLDYPLFETSESISTAEILLL